MIVGSRLRRVYQGSWDGYFTVTLLMAPAAAAPSFLLQLLWVCLGLLVSLSFSTCPVQLPGP